MRAERRNRWLASASAGCLLALTAVHTSAAPTRDEVNALKEDAIGLELKLRAIERRDRPKDRHRVDVYLLLDSDQFQLDSARVAVEGEATATHDYLPLEARALARGGAHHILSTDLAPGDYRLQADFEGGFLIDRSLDHGLGPHVGKLSSTFTVDDADLQIALPLRRVDARAVAAATRPGDVRVDAVRYLVEMQRYFEALLLLAETGASVGGKVPADDRGWLLARALVGFSMRERAEQVMAALSPEAYPSRWADLHLDMARIDYRRNEPARAMQQLDAVADTLNTEQRRRWRELRAQILLDDEAYEDVVALLDEVTDPTLGMQLNHGIALMRSGAPVRGEVVLESLIRGTEYSRLARNIRDRARLYLSQRYFEMDRPVDARRVLADSGEGDIYPSVARLARGWGEYEPADSPGVSEPVAERAINRAMKEWQPMLDGPLIDLNVQEALVAVAFVQERAGDDEAALDAYQQAVQRLEAAREGMQQSRDAIRSGRMVETILRADSDLEGGVDWRLTKLPDVEELDWLLGYLATHDFQEPFKQMRDLRLIQSRMQAHAAAISADFDAEQRKRYADLRASLRTPGRQWRGQSIGEGPKARELPHIESLRVRAFELANEQAATLETMTLAELERMQAATRGRLVEARLAIARFFDD